MNLGCFEGAFGGYFDAFDERYGTGGGDCR